MDVTDVYDRLEHAMTLTGAHRNATLTDLLHRTTTGAIEGVNAQDDSLLVVCATEGTATRVEQLIAGMRLTGPPALTNHYRLIDGRWVAHGHWDAD